MTALRLVEHEPSWEWHSLLRILRLDYAVEVAPTRMGLGRTLPIIVDDGVIYEGLDILSAPTISSALALNPSRSSDLLIGSYLIVQADGLLIEYEALSGASFSMLPDLVKGMMSLMRCGWYLPIRQNRALWSFPAVKELIARLDARYAELEEKLRGKSKQPLGCSWVSQSEDGSVSCCYGYADAVLFGHFCRAQKYPEVVKVLDKYPAIRSFIQHLAAQYFSLPAESSLSWMMADYLLLHNPNIAREEAAFTRSLMPNEIDKALVERVAWERNKPHDVVDEDSVLSLAFPSWKFSFDSFYGVVCPLTEVLMLTVTAAAFVRFGYTRFATRS